jgi:hypothetical protein
MAEQQVNIDFIFRNGLKDFEVLPPPEVWERIRPASTGRRKALLFLRIAAVAVILLGVGVTSYYLTRNISTSLNGSVITMNQDVMPSGFYLEKSETPVPEHKVAVADLISDDVDNSSTEDILPAFRLDEISLFKPIVAENNRRTVENSLPLPVRSSSVGNYADEDNYSVDREAGVSAITGENSRWSVGAMVSPTYYSSLYLSGNDAGRDINNAEKAAISYSGGVSFSYSVSKRISIQSGIYYSSLGQKVTGVSSYSGFGNFFESKGPGDFIVKTSSGPIISDNHDIYLLDGKEAGRVMTQYTLDVFDPVKSNLSYVNSSLHQNFNYLELPIVMRYKILDRKVDFNLIGAISYNILLANSAYTYYDGIKTYIGKTDGLNPFTLSSALGMGVEYNLTDHLLFNLEPTFRYYMTPLGGISGSSIHPYSFGILSGVSFRF